MSFSDATRNDLIHLLLSTMTVDESKGARRGEEKKNNFIFDLARTRRDIY